MQRKAWLTVLFLSLAGCGDSGLNPLGWFSGQSEPETETLNAVDLADVEDDRPFVPVLTAVRIDPTPGGAIVRATGLPAVQGWHSASLEPRGTGDAVGGVLTFDFRAVPPEVRTRVSTPVSREIIVGYTISNVALQDVRSIRVVSASNVLTVRR